MTSAGGREWTERRRQREGAGRRAEDIAALFLRCKGYGIEARRLRTPAGEIDIVARRGAMLVFVEVKARAGIVAALEAVSPRQRRRIERAAAWYAGRRSARPTTAMRFDVVVVRPWRLPAHLRDAWRPAG